MERLNEEGSDETAHEILENSGMKTYLRDIMHEKGCEESVTAAIKERMMKLITKCEEILPIPA